MSAGVGFALATALHAGFQLVVSVVVYPALLEVGAADFARAHDAHSRRIVGLVVPVYAAVIASGVALVLAGPGALGWVALVLTAGALAVTAAAAAPTHGRLAAEDSACLRERLLSVDRLRCGLAVLGAVGAIAALL